MWKYLFAFLLTLSLQPLAHAQFSNLLKDLKGAVGAIQRGETPVISNTGNEANSSSSASGDYCQRVSQSPTVKQYVELFKTAQNDKVSLDSRFERLKLDNEQNELSKTIQSKVNSAGGTDFFKYAEYLRQLNQKILECAKANADTDLFLFFAEQANRLDSIESQRNSLKRGSLSWGGPPPRDKTTPINSYWASLYALSFDDGESLIQKTFSGTPDLIRAEIAKSNQSKEKRLAEMQQKAQADAIKEAAAKKRREEAAAFEASPDGQLMYSYQHFQIVQLCNEIRKGYAVQFVNDAEFNDYKNSMRKIESKLKNLVNGANTDRLWQLAEKNNRSFGAIEIDGKKMPGMDYFEAIRNNNKTNWMSAKSDCDIQAEAFRGMVKTVLGNEPVKKSF